MCCGNRMKGPPKSSSSRQLSEREPMALERFEKGRGSEKDLPLPAKGTLATFFNSAPSPDGATATAQESRWGLNFKSSVADSVLCLLPCAQPRALPTILPPLAAPHLAESSFWGEHLSPHIITSRPAAPDSTLHVSIFFLFSC